MVVNEKLLDDLQNETSSTRLCGTCGFPLDLSMFYRDGKDRDGNTKYRRDCKDCYKKIRMAEKRNKVKATFTARPKQRRKKK